MTDSLRTSNVWKPILEDEVRLLHITSPCSRSRLSPFYAELSIHKLDDTCPPYEAMSYRWGTIHSDGSHLTNTIICNGEPMEVTAHLLQGLRRLQQVQLSGLARSDFYDFRDRHHTPEFHRQSRPLWVDALCIDQHNDEERSAQVRLMGRIFKSAVKVLVWFGEPSTQRMADALQKWWTPKMEGSREYTADERSALEDPPEPLLVPTLDYSGAGARGTAVLRLWR